MKKIVLIAFAVIFTAATMSAQSGKAFEKGYRGNVSLTGNIGINKAFFNNGIELTTSHVEKPCARDPRSPVPLTLAVQNSLTL